MSSVNSVLMKLGGKRVKEICEAGGLGEKDSRIVIEILDEWENLVGEIVEKMEVAIKKTRSNPNREKIFIVVMRINIEFADAILSIK